MKTIPIITVLVEKFKPPCVSLVVDWTSRLHIPKLLLGCHVLLLIYVLRFVLIVVGIWIGIVVIRLSEYSVIVLRRFIALSILAIKVKIIVFGFYNWDLG